MTASFFWARAGQGKNPVDAIDLLGDARARPHLRDCFAGSLIRPSIDLPSDSAILMSGPTDELQEALRSDISQGVQDIRVEGLMAIWYVRWRRSITDPVITVVSIASVQGYWDLKMNDPLSSGHRWRRMYQGHCYKGGIELEELVNPLLPMAQGKNQWQLRALRDDEAEPNRDAEAYLSSQTPEGFAMTPDPDERYLVGELRTVSNDDARAGATKAYWDKVLTRQWQQKTQDGFPEVVNQFIQDVGRSEIRVGGDRTRGTLLNPSGKGDQDPRQVLRKFAGTSVGALNLSKFLNQYATSAVTELRNSKGENLVPGMAPPLPNTKVEFYSAQRNADSFVIDYELDAALKSIGKGGPISLILDEKKSWIQGSMQISISVRNLEAGNLTSYTFTKKPQFAMRTGVTTASLREQVEAAPPPST
jgi:hypothetical protein